MDGTGFIWSDNKEHLLKPLRVDQLCVHVDRGLLCRPVWLPLEIQN